MATNFYPLIYKPGIKKDGTQIQSEYCTDGQWVRFQRGVIRRMGGESGLIVGGGVTQQGFPSTILLMSSSNGNGYYAYVATSFGSAKVIRRITFNANFEKVSDDLLHTADLTASSRYQFDVVVRNGIKTIVAFIKGGFRSNDTIIVTTPAKIIHAPVETGNPQFVETDIQGLDPKANTGICYSFPYLFAYGKDGFVSYSKTSDPFDFRENGGSGSFTLIPADNVIYGSPIRGGSSNPSLLFWTISSVVKITNVGDNEVRFQQDVISQSCSILSTRSVVELDGMFFWVGTDKFYVYNGLVTALPNTMNLNYFFDTLDINYRQDVFAIKNPRYDEIWWFYPIKGSGVRGCQGVIIYNKREASWYNTRIAPRYSGVYFDLEGFMCTLGAGNGDAFPTASLVTLWKHEVGENSTWVIPPAPRQYSPIPSSFTTPFFSWVSFNPMKQPTGVNRWVDLKTIQPDFILSEQESPAAAISLTVTVLGREYPQLAYQVPATSFGPYNFKNTTDKIDVYAQARYMQLRFTGTKNYEVGHILLEMGVGDGK